MKTNNKVLAVQLPAMCPLHCDFCRTPDHNDGNLTKVINAVNKLLDKNNYSEIYLTSNGETGFSDIFQDMIEKAKEKRIPVSVLGATSKSVVPGLKRIEISFNEFTEMSATKAIKKARSFNIPIILSIIDDGKSNISPIEVLNDLSVDGVLVRALQKEGKSNRSTGKSSFILKNGKDIGIFPVTSYIELKSFGINSDCVNHYGNIVPFLGKTA